LRLAPALPAAVSMTALTEARASATSAALFVRPFLKLDTAATLLGFDPLFLCDA
jgi:hypothetical protein